MKLFPRTRIECAHLSDHVAEPRTQYCEECGSTFNLRICTECGHVGCCESQQGHNTAHARASGHPVIKSFPVGAGSFTWCYSCRAYVQNGTT
ncbi:MAG TPA: UBP-type zinc finger domain-containing protein [Chloroflexota bacterium]